MIAVVVAVAVAAAAVELVGQGNFFFPLFDYRNSDLMHCWLRILILWMDARLDGIGQERRLD